MKQLFLAATALVFAAVPAYAQRAQELIATVPSVQQTYWASAVAVTPAASQTDFFTITGSATKTVIVKHIDCTATSTAAGSYVAQLVLRTTANTGGTASTLAITKADSLNATATAVAKSYTVVPTLGTGVAFATGNITSGPAATVQVFPSFSYDFGANNTQPVVLHGVAQTLSVNGQAASMVSGATFSCTATWTEQ